MNPITITNIAGKDWKKFGIIHKGPVADGQNAEILPNVYIRLFGLYKNRVNPQPHDITFYIGDSAEYDSYNLHYVGKITAIKEKYVEIEEPYGNDKRHRLDIYTFNRRNWDFNADRIAKENFEESQYI